jgi:prevent-host-death family protein
MMQANISDMKNNLSSYVAKVRTGETVLILDRHTPVARLVPIDEHDTLLIREPTVPPAQVIRRSLVRLRDPVDVVELLRLDRDER